MHKIGTIQNVRRHQRKGFWNQTCYWSQWHTSVVIPMCGIWYMHVELNIQHEPTWTPQKELRSITRLPALYTKGNNYRWIITWCVTEFNSHLTVTGARFMKHRRSKANSLLPSADCCSVLTDSSESLISTVAELFIPFVNPWTPFLPGFSCKRAN